MKYIRITALVIGLGGGLVACGGAPDDAANQIAATNQLEELTVSANELSNAAVAVNEAQNATVVAAEKSVAPASTTPPVKAKPKPTPAPAPKLEPRSVPKATKSAPTPAPSAEPKPAAPAPATCAPEHRAMGHC